MYERFSDNARQVMNLAYAEARRLKREYIDSQHLLLALARVEQGTAAKVMMKANVRLDQLRQEIECLVVPESNVVRHRWQFLWRWLADDRPSEANRAKKAIENAIEEARQLGQDYVGTEHLLLGLLREQESVACVLLTKLGLTLDVARETIRAN